MNINVRTISNTIAIALMAISAQTFANWNPQPNWKDSYAVDGQCFCDSSNYDHNLSSKSANTPEGLKNVVQICNDIREVLGTGSEEGRIPYNDIQCGHGPANDAADEAGCPGRVDIGPAGCNVKGPTWNLAAVYGNGTTAMPAPAPAPETISAAEPTPTPTPTPNSTVTSAEACTIYTEPGASLAAAKLQFAQACPQLARQDCDPISGNRWMCSTQNITNGRTVPSSAPLASTTPEPTPAAAMPVETPTTNSGNCEALGANLTSAKQAYASTCPNIPRRDCDPTSNGRWLCSSGVIGARAPGINAQSTNTSTPQQPVVVTTPATPAASEPSVPTNNNPSIGRVGGNDLVALHYDNCPDRDDGHAIAAGKSVVTRVGLTNVLVINGTCGDSIRNLYQPEGEAVAQASWGSQWLDYFNAGEATIQASANQWVNVLANDGDVWVAEGGPSDFTAKVLRRIQNQMPSLDLKNVHVVQHSTGSGFNEARTSSENIELVKRVADYRAIPNGNNGGNGSANFRQNSSFFVDTARQSEFSNEWSAAFDYLDPNRRLDFSDTVELLYIIDETETKTVNDFAQRYLR